MQNTQLNAAQRRMPPTPRGDRLRGAISMCGLFAITQATITQATIILPTIILSIGIVTHPASGDENGVPETRTQVTAVENDLEPESPENAIAESAFAPPQVPGGDKPDIDGFYLLFDGETLAGWRGYQQTDVPGNWVVDEGHIKGTGEGVDLVTIGTYGNFELQFEWKIESQGNSGVIYRAAEHGQRAHNTGIEYQIIDDHQGTDGVPPVHSTGAIYGLYCDEQKTLHPVGEYNTSKIVAKGPHLEHWLNGQLVAECEIGSDDWKQKIAASKFLSWTGFAEHPRGHLALQAHGHPIWFRNLKLKPLELDQPQ